MKILYKKKKSAKRYDRELLLNRKSLKWQQQNYQKKNKQNNIINTK